MIIFLSEEKWKKTKSVLDVSQEGLGQNFVRTQLEQTRAAAREILTKSSVKLVSAVSDIVTGIEPTCGLEKKVKVNKTKFSVVTMLLSCNKYFLIKNIVLA